MLADEHSERIVPGKNGMFLPTIVSNGKVVGRWRRRSTASDVEVTPEERRRMAEAGFYAYQ